MVVPALLKSLGTAARLSRDGLGLGREGRVSGTEDSRAGVVALIGDAGGCLRASEAVGDDIFKVLWCVDGRTSDNDGKDR